MWYQKSRAKWLEYGDRNTKYFHGVTSIRRRRNHITALRNDDGAWIDNSRDLECLAMDYYKVLFSEDTVLTPFPVSHSFPPLDEVCVHDLNKEVTDAEIFNTIKSFGAFKAPGLDGFKPYFTIANAYCWSFIV